MTDCTLAHSVVPFARVTAEGEARPRGQDALSGGLPCYGVYETSDGGYMALGALEIKFWQAFCEAVARPDLIACFGCFRTELPGFMRPPEASQNAS